MRHFPKEPSFQTSREEMAHQERILVVDDEETIRNLFLDFLGGGGYQVVTAESGEAALRKFKPHFFDCVISDISMPGMGGLELLKKLKEKDPTVIFLMITGYPSIQDAVEAMKLGAYDYITKPLQLDDLQIKVERALYTRNLEKSITIITKRLRGLLLLIPTLLIIIIGALIIWGR
jgi:DNA-binding NtrC family response regulator